MTWAFTRICGYGVWRYLDKHKRSFSPRFLFVYTLRTSDYSKFQTSINKEKNNYYEKDIIFIMLDYYPLLLL